jgi:hypothetical protein
MKSFNLLLNNMSSKLNNAPIVHGEPTNFFAKKPSIFAKHSEQPIQNTVVMPSQVDTLPAKKRGRPKLENHDKKNAKLSLIFSETQREQLTTALARYNEIKQDDVFFTPPSMNEFVVTLIFTNPELKKLLSSQ